VVSNHDAGLVLNHMRGRPDNWARLGPMPDPVAGIARDLGAAVSRARHIGISPSKLVIDPVSLRQAQGAERAHPGPSLRARAIDLPIMAALAQEFSGS